MHQSEKVAEILKTLGKQLVALIVGREVIHRSSLAGAHGHKAANGILLQTPAPSKQPLAPAGIAHLDPCFVHNHLL